MRCRLIVCEKSGFARKLYKIQVRYSFLVIFGYWKTVFVFTHPEHALKRFDYVKHLPYRPDTEIVRRWLEHHDD